MNMNLYFVCAQWKDGRDKNWIQDMAIETDLELKTVKQYQVFTEKVKADISEFMKKQTGVREFYCLKILNISKLN